MKFTCDGQVALLSKQGGAALLMIMLVLVLFFSFIFLTGLDKASSSLSKHKRTDRALSVAKQSLINFALLSDRLPGSAGIGYLPCPDLDGDGVSDAPCGLAGDSVEGWLPWQTLGEKSLKGGAKVCLRYAVSGNYKINPSSPLIKSPATVGQFVIHDQNNNIAVGANASEYALAVVFAPGTTVAGQSRALGGGVATRCGSSNINAAKNRAVNYLDLLNNVNNARGTYAGPGVAGSAPLPTNTPSVFIQSESQDGFNDRLIWISPRDFVAVYARMP